MPAIFSSYICLVVHMHCARCSWNSGWFLNRFRPRNRINFSHWLTTRIISILYSSEPFWYIINIKPTATSAWSTIFSSLVCDVMTSHITLNLEVFILRSLSAALIHDVQLYKLSFVFNCVIELSDRDNRWLVTASIIYFITPNVLGIFINKTIPKQWSIYLDGEVISQLTSRHLIYNEIILYFVLDV